MKLFHKRGGGVNWISYLLFRTTYALGNTVKILNKDFIKAVEGGGHRFMKLFHKIPLFCFGKASLSCTIFFGRVNVELAGLPQGGGWWQEYSISVTRLCTGSFSAKVGYKTICKSMDIAKPWKFLNLKLLKGHRTKHICNLLSNFFFFSEPLLNKYIFWI